MVEGKCGVDRLYRDSRRRSWVMTLSNPGYVSSVTGPKIKRELGPRMEIAESATTEGWADALVALVGVAALAGATIFFH